MQIDKITYLFQTSEYGVLKKINDLTSSDDKSVCNKWINIIFIDNTSSMIENARIVKRPEPTYEELKYSSFDAFLKYSFKERRKMFSGFKHDCTMVDYWLSVDVNGDSFNPKEVEDTVLEIVTEGLRYFYKKWQDQQ